MSEADDWVIRPERFVRYLREERGLSAPEVRLPTRGILVFGDGDLRMFSRMLHARILGWNERFASGRIGRSRVVVFRTTIGAPAATLNLEEAIALGLRTVIAFGSCGSLLQDLPIGSVVLPRRAYSEEGTSAHYGGTRWSKPDSGVADSLRAACEEANLAFREGATWTTDAPYRESRAKARLLARQGVVCVEMEASALWRVARLRNVRAASLLVVSDELDGPEWNAGFRDPRFLAAKRRASEVVLEALRRSPS